MLHDSTLLLDIWRKLEVLSTDIRAIREQVDMTLHWVRRFLIVGCLWFGGLVGNMSNDQLAEIGARLIRHLIGG
jgi:hypothetical protein